MIRHSPNVVTLTTRERLVSEHFDRMLEIGLSATQAEIDCRGEFRHVELSEEFWLWLVH